MPNYKSKVMDITKMTTGAVVTSVGVGYVQDKFLKDINFVQDFPEVVDGTVVGVGVVGRYSVPRSIKPVMDGVAVAGMIGVTDDLINRFFGKDLI